MVNLWFNLVKWNFWTCLLAIIYIQTGHTGPGSIPEYSMWNLLCCFSNGGFWVLPVITLLILCWTWSVQ